MSVHYIIDGYNLIKQTSLLSSKTLEEGREGLIQLIRKNNLTGSPRNEVTIVFDGRKDVVSPRTEKIFKIIFACESADDKIKKMISSSENPNRIILVTNDKELIFFARSYRAGTCGISEFLNKISRRENKTNESKEDFRLNFAAAAEITEELGKIWLKGKEGANRK